MVIENLKYNAERRKRQIMVCQNLQGLPVGGGIKLHSTYLLLSPSPTGNVPISGEKL